jgi:alpha-methylacyl-CoA racemase
LRTVIAAVLRTRTRDDWAKEFADTDGCVAPVLSLTEATTHPHNAAREVFTTAFGVVQPAPVPRFGRTPGAIASAPPLPGEGSAQALLDWGLDAAQISDLTEAGVLGPDPTSPGSYE